MRSSQKIYVFIAFQEDVYLRRRKQTEHVQVHN